MNKGILYLCATPIGNLEDITLRVIRILREVDYIAAEDTRHTLKLLNHLGISKPLISYHKFSDGDREEKILSLLKEGNKVALVSDAGMPGISDPGEGLVNRAHKMKIPVTVLPGPTAGLSALILSGFPCDRFVFEGFLPKIKKERNIILDQLKDEERTIVLYETPHRLSNSLEEIFGVFGDRRVAVVKELTKIHEGIIIFSLGEAVTYFNQEKPRGEYVLIIEGKDISQKEDRFQNVPIRDHILGYIEAGMTKKEAIKRVARERNIPKGRIYEHSLGLPNYLDK